MASTNVSINFSFDGKVYAGLALSEGVGIDIVADPFGSGRQLLSFPFCSVYPAGLFWDAVSAIEINAEPAQCYLVLYPDEG